MLDKLPIAISVPHAGLKVPSEVREINLLSSDEIREDGDVGAQEIYFGLKNYVEKFYASDIARAFVDLNRVETDFSRDGVIKSHTCWDQKVYKDKLTMEVVKKLLSKYHRPYHEALSQCAETGVLLCVDCHTMAAKAPSVAPDAYSFRPNVCIGDGLGACPPKWVNALVDSF
ncbi:MAG: N-formylglutamate amidohydrolase, partial [Planctomycetes bacterium]|nr:N-formylglutamate amidohydrolase [Planctomycetota bacterium]